MKRQHVKAHFLTFLTSCIIFPIALLAWLLNRKKVRACSKSFFSLCVNLDKGEAQYELVEELGCNSIQVRFFLADMHRLEEYCQFLKGFKGKEVLLVVVQSREHIEDSERLRVDIQRVFEAFFPFVQKFQIGTTINRSKWGFFSVDEYLRFFKVAQSVRDHHFSGLSLLGPSVIDFEYPYVLRALFNLFPVRFDMVAALLYVDRRGAPENTQLYLFDTYNKIGFLHSIIRLSPKSSDRLLLTETNWPLENTAPWAPTSETECVSEFEYANYMLRYYLQAIASCRVEAVYWHQLIANGYGLVDSREGLRKREAFYVYRTMLELLGDVEVQAYLEHGNVYHLDCQNSKNIVVLWCNGKEESLQTYAERYQLSLDNRKIIDKTGHEIGNKIMISDSPIYLVER